MYRAGFNRRVLCEKGVPTPKWYGQPLARARRGRRGRPRKPRSHNFSERIAEPRPMARRRRAAGAQTPPLLQSETEARAQNETGSGSCGHFAAPKLPRKRHRTDKPRLPRAPDTLRRQTTQSRASSAHARVPNGPRNRHGRKNDCLCRRDHTLHSCLTLTRPQNNSRLRISLSRLRMTPVYAAGRVPRAP